VMKRKVPLRWGLGTITASLLFSISFTLLATQIYGLTQESITSPATFPQRGSVPGYHFFNSDQRDSVLRALERGYEAKADSFKYVEGLTSLVYSSIQHGTATELHPTHSWVGYAMSKIKGRTWMYTQNPSVIAKSGVGNCSQSVRVITEIARRDGVKARVVNLDGHVVAEILIGGFWKMSDPDYGIAFDGSVRDASRGTSADVIRERILSRGHTIATANNYLQILDQGQKGVGAIWAPNEPKPRLIERLGVLLSWILPIVGIGLALLLQLPQLKILASKN
jgi:hypothetical protein